MFAIGNDTSFTILADNPRRGLEQLGLPVMAPRLQIPAVGRNADGRLEVFVIGGNGALYRQWQTTPGGAWSNWDHRGGDQLVGSNLAVAKNRNGELEVFVIGGDGALYHQWQTNIGGPWTTWNKRGGSNMKKYGYS